MSMYSDNMNNCGSCALWGGSRTSDGSIFPAPFVNIDNDESGKCMGGGYSNMKMRAIQGCSKWQLWPGLKKLG